MAQKADLFLLLLSPDFFASDYINHVELAEALRRHDAGTACVIPIVLRPCQWKLTRLRKLQVLPTDGKPAGSRDEAFLDIADGIARVVMAQQPVS